MDEDYKNKTGTYVAFYVEESTAIGGRAQTAKDLCNYRTIEMWKESTDNIHFVNSHDKTDNVRDDSDYEKTLLPRLKKRLRLSKNMFLLLSSITRESRALRDEIKYAAELGLPIIVVYVDIGNNGEIKDDTKISNKAKKYWEKLPTLKKYIKELTITTMHIPFSKSHLNKALNDSDLTIQGMDKNNNHTYFYKE